MTSSLLYLAEIIAFPAAVAGGLTYLTVTESERFLKSRKTSAIIESELQNENMDPGVQSTAKWLLFALYFNLTYMTVNIALVQETLFNTPYVYAAAIAAFVIATFIALSFAFRFHEKRYVITGVAFSVLGTVVILASLQLGFGHWTAYGSSASSASTGTTLTGRTQDLIVPIVMAGVAWAITLVSFLLDLNLIEHHLPFRFERPGSYNLLMAAVVIGYIGVTLSVLHPLLSLL
ncbi:MAG: hypothetical protein M1144_04760 [Candidatus Thermoplasmatota archaeon]|jgi:hypothetical protein|nr:hypothetical protein [Candidatus Thermoplasmatota archaeon]MCL5984262.1 hypothetical protein [Candidatus Thermoplasmatota archaeon]